MKKLITLCTLVCLAALATMAFAVTPGKVVTDYNNRGTGYHSPDPATSKCTTTTTTKGTIDSVTVAGGSTLAWEASDSSNAAKRIRRFINSNTAYLPATGEKIGLNNKMTTVTFKPYSAASAAYTVCSEIQTGGKTP